MRLQESSGLVNPLGLRERSEYNERPPNFGKGFGEQKSPQQDHPGRRLDYPGEYPFSLEDTDKFNMQKLRGIKESSDEMTLDMLRSKGPANEG